MKKIRTHLLATAAVAALSSSAFAADMGMPMKSPPPAPIPVATWEGSYIGANIGVARLNSSCTEVTPSYGYYGSCTQYYGQASTVNSATGFAAGVEVGHDWQQRYFVYGVAADWTWTDLKHTSMKQSDIASVTQQGFQSKVDWLASFRGRMGLAVDDTLVYVTGGLALGQVNDTNIFCDSSGCGNYGHLDSVRVGWVGGAGVEHKLNQNWSVKGEFLYYDLGHATGSGYLTASEPGTTEFNNEVLEGRMGIAYRW